MNETNKMDNLLSALDGGVLIFQSEHAALNAFISTKRDHASSLPDGTDFAIVTPTQYAEMSLYEPEVSIIDKRDEMPHNPDPFHPDYLKYLKETWVDDWPSRSEMGTRVEGLTIHHTLSHSPLATSQYITATKGYPRTQYHYWVSQDDGCPIYYLLDEDYAPYHDHRGVSPNLSIGMAGSLHLTRPPEEQLWSTVLLVAHLMSKHSLTKDNIDGHHERAALSGVHTLCPGWMSGTSSGAWKRDACIALEECLQGETWGGY